MQPSANLFLSHTTKHCALIMCATKPMTGQFGTLIQAGRVPSAKRDLADAHTLSWGHAMQPGKIYGSLSKRRRKITR